MKRRAARELAFILIFELGFNLPNNNDATTADSAITATSAVTVAETVYNGAILYRPDEVSDSPYVRAALVGVAKNLETLDSRISRRLDGWTLERLPRTSLALLRLAVYEMAFGGIPHTVAINEAVELAKIYGEDETPGYINGVLNSIAEDVGAKGRNARSSDDES